MIEGAPPGASSTSPAGRRMRLTTRLVGRVIAAERTRLAFAGGAQLSCILPVFVDLRPLFRHVIEAKLTQTLDDEVTCELLLTHGGEPLLWLLDGVFDGRLHLPEQLGHGLPPRAPALVGGAAAHREVGPWSVWDRAIGPHRSLVAFAR